MNAQLNLQNILMARFLEFKTKNPSFSLRAFARKLEMGPTPLNEILKGKRRVSKEMAEKIASKLQLDPMETALLLKDFPEKLKRTSKHRDHKSIDLKMMKLNADQFNLIADWAHYAILSLMRTEDFVSDVSWIAKRLGIKEVHASECISRLQGLGLITYNQYGELRATHGVVQTTDDVLNVSIQKSHLNDLEMAKEKMSSVDVKMRDYTSVNVPLDPEFIPKLKKMIREFQDNVFELAQESRCKEVYKMNIYLYPLTEIGKSTGVTL